MDIAEWLTQHSLAAIKTECSDGIYVLVKGAKVYDGGVLREMRSYGKNRGVAITRLLTLIEDRVMLHDDAYTSRTPVFDKGSVKRYFWPNKYRAKKLPRLRRPR